MTNYTPAQLEAWAGLGPWEWCENWLYVANYNEHPGPVLWYTANDDGVHAKPDDAALIAAAPDLARLVLEKEKEIAELKTLLAQASDAIEGKTDDLDERICCNGHYCGCMGATNRSFLLYHIRQAMKGTSDE